MMMFRHFRRLVIFGLWLLCSGGPASGEDGEFATSRLVVTGDGGRHVFTVELAVSAAQLSQGLQNRRQLAPDAGMLFDFKVSRPVSFWMKNTYLPLDIMFIAADGGIVEIVRDATPLSLTKISPSGPARAVLEVNAGTAKRLGINIGDRVEHPVFAAPGKD